MLKTMRRLTTLKRKESPIIPPTPIKIIGTLGNVKKRERSGVQKMHMASGGFRFLLLTFQYLVGWGLINMVISMNSPLARLAFGGLFRLVHIANYQRRSAWFASRAFCGA